MKLVRVKDLLRNRKLYKLFRGHTYRALWYFVIGNEPMFAYHINEANRIHELLQAQAEADQ